MSTSPRQVEEAGDSVYLDAYLAPLAPWLADEEVTEILVNRAGSIWVEAAGAGMRPIDLPALDDRHLRRLAEQVARVSNQGINREQPLLAATLPGGARVQFVAPSATRAGWAMAIRRHRIADLPLTAYDRGPLPEPVSEEAWPDLREQPIAFLSRAVRERRTILVSGGTSTGKTSFLNALLAEVPRHERIVLVEDTPEIRLRHENALGLVAVKGELGEARVAADDLIQAALRMRPDRIVLGELRGREAVSFLRAINTGHPGSFTTIHANSPVGALEQLALMVMQSGLGFSRSDTLAYARSMIDIVVQLERVAGRRQIAAIERIGTAAID